MTAYSSHEVRAFLQAQESEILNQLLSSDSATGFSQVSHKQLDAWRVQIALLKTALAEASAAYRAIADGSVLLEYRIPRREKRIDAILLFSKAIIVIEFKVGSTTVADADRSQLLDYVLDLAYYHEQSTDCRIIPLLCPTKYPGIQVEAAPSLALIGDLIVCGGASISKAIAPIIAKDVALNLSAKSLDAWIHSRYKPIPGIIDAAVSLFSKHNVEDIDKALAQTDTIERTIEFSFEVIRDSLSHGRKRLCLLTGVPGSGKTLTGLRLAHLLSTKRHDWNSVFMSGNGPLLKVLRSALAIDYASNQGVPRIKAKLFAEAMIHSVHAYLHEVTKHSVPPAERVVIFDEAQRAWDQNKMIKMAGRAQAAARMIDKPTSTDVRSEPWQILEVLNRHKGGAVVLALCGNGQEIHDGEAGVGEWINARDQGFENWELICSPAALGLLKGAKPSAYQLAPEMHLDVPLRAHRATRHALWVDAVLNGRTSEARSNVDHASFPILLTDNLDAARNWLRKTTLGSRRHGILASSGGARLRPYGLEVSADFRKSVDYPLWFTAPKGDLRSSFALEVAATEFECQGLELDRTCVAWSWDLAPNGVSLVARSFRGTRWKRVNSSRECEYIVNKYRVLLTRAREGMVIWVPKGEPNDSSREPAEMNALRSYLVECGVRPLSS